MSDYSEELKVAKQAADEAAEIIRSFQREKNFNVNFKGRNDLVTDADVAAEKKIIEIITGHFPGDQIMAEESATEQVLPIERIWLIDPIDGTTNFAHGFPIYCVSIALWEKGEAKAGLVLEVNNHEYFEAMEGKGAYCNGERIHVSEIKEPTYALIGTGFPYSDLSIVTNYLQLFEWLMHHTQAVRRPGAASYDLCCVAAGQFDGFYEYSLNAWDVGAASLIVQEAGGVISDWEGGENWLFGERIIAGNPEIHSFLLRAVQEHFPKEQLGL